MNLYLWEEHLGFIAEFNYWVDPHGADYVYKNLPKKIHMVGLDVTRKIVLTPNIIEFINRLDKDMAKYITEITRFYIDFHWEQEGIIGCVINDPLAVAYFIDRSLLRGFVLTEVDEKAFMKMFLKRIFKEHESAIESIEGVI